MTCGACAPDAFCKGAGKVFGYLVAPNIHTATSDARRLYYMGAAAVFADEPKGNVSHRHGFARMRKIMRPR